ncbi:MAG: NAD(+) synthase [Sphaerochaetaceae bacterium]|jgi:NAD+ synthase (glutamine-hydrolysing)|nr:NAD(+) synthase [Sphaerochaetaceae bacterium]
MKDGFVKTAVATNRVSISDCRYNTNCIVTMMHEAAAVGVKLLVFPELSVTGYTCGDLFFQPLLQQKALDGLLTIVSETETLDMVALVGLPIMFEGKLYNCAAVISHGSILGIVPKTHLPNYGEFYEQRWFARSPVENGTLMIGKTSVPFGTKLIFRCASLPTFLFAVEICEDLWVSSPPSVSHAEAGAVLIANLSASNDLIGKREYRRQLVQNQSASCVCAYLYANAGSGESSTDLVFTGHSLIAENGIMLAEANYSDTALVVADIDIARLAFERSRMTTFFPSDRTGYQIIDFSLAVEQTQLSRSFPKHPFVPTDPTVLDQRCSDIIALQATALCTRLVNTKIQSVTLGISGGLDSTLALLVCVEAFDKLNIDRSNITVVTMPCFGTTKRTLRNANRLCTELDLTLRTIDITASVNAHFKDIEHDPAIHNVVFENSQARERTQVLMDIANQQGALVVGTGDLSELALGWATYNGDHMSMYGVNASVPKTLVRHLVDYYRRRRSDGDLKAVLKDILDTPVSPELLPAVEGKMVQPTEEIVGPYELHDYFLYYMLRWGYAPAKILRIAVASFEGVYDRETILSWMKVFYHRFFTQQFKRSCLPDGPKIGSIALSPRGDWRMPSDASVSTWKEELDRL